MSDYGYLPRTARELAEQIGLPDTLEIMRVYGGHPLDIPRKASPNVLLAKTISPQALETLCSQWGGVRIPHIPVFAKINKHHRNQAIYEANKAGETISTLARRYNLCTRRVNKIIEQQRSSDDTKEQLSLFQEQINPQSNSSLLRGAWRASR